MNYNDISPETSYKNPIEYVAGGNAYSSGLDISANPFKKGTKEFSDWQHGWYDHEGYDDYTKLKMDLNPQRIL